MKTIELLFGGIIVVSTLVDIFQSVVVTRPEDRFAWLLFCLMGYGLIHCLAISVPRSTSQFDEVLGCIP
jgi:hypothetical protein